MVSLWEGVEEMNVFVACACIFGLILSQLSFLIVAIQWLHPVDETPHNARLFRMNIQEKVAFETGAPLLPKTVLNVRELKNLYARKCFKTRGYELSEEDQSLLNTAKDGQVNYISASDQFSRNPSLAYGTLYSKRVSCLDFKPLKVEPSGDGTTSTRIMHNVLNTQDEEDAVRKPLKRQKKDIGATKRKKNNKKKAIQALDKMTAGEPVIGDAKTLEIAPQSVRNVLTPPKLAGNNIQPGKIAQPVAVNTLATLNTVDTIEHSKKESRRKQAKRRKSVRRLTQTQTLKTENGPEESPKVRKSLEDLTKSKLNTVE
ncbi:unnamed protein product [Caenorhabditis angaria]|uniref:Uncharacterized protein n=1 Tax=Caenorhabditis angaria TaxID=860376 RepID=A0A9P1N336_9PELO|nr:unnamed protein product [Caenorhabditis angaria]